MEGGKYNCELCCGAALLIHWFSMLKKWELAKKFPCKMSGRRDSNPLPTAWEAVALPGELLPLFNIQI
jgi:hypothetical protein